MQLDFASGPHDGWPVAGVAPAGSLVQAPTLLGTLHAWHEPPHAESQHTPSTQKPLAQLLPTWQG